MSWTELAQLITAAGAFIAAAGSILVSLRNGEKIEEVHKATNGLTKRLVASTAKSSRAAGVKQEHDRNKRARNR